MRAGVIDSVLREGPSDVAVFELARRLGFQGVEVALRGQELRSRQRLAALREAKAASGLEIPSLIMAGHVDDGGIADADPTVSAKAVADIRAAIAWAAELAADVILVPFFLGSELRRDDVERCVSAFRALCPEADAVGVTLCYEGTLAAADVKLLAARVGSSAFGCYFDLANPVVEGLDTATEARALADLIRRVHFKDALVRRGDCAPGRGRVDFQESARALEEIGYDGWVVLETPAGPPDVVARDFRFAREVFPALARPP